MKRVICFLLCSAMLATGLAQNINIRFKTFGTRISARPDLEIHWEAPTNALPTNIWVYRLLPRKLSPTAIAYLRDTCSFTDKDKADDGDVLTFKSQGQNGSRQLQICFSRGIISYEAPERRPPRSYPKSMNVLG